MNLIEQLNIELHNKHLTDLEKARYIYLRCCEIFSFDSRWFYTDLFDDTKLHNNLLNKKFNIEDINDQLVICHSFSKYILKPLIEELTKLDCRITGDDIHSYVTMNYDNQDWKMDATMGDLARVKLELPTRGFTSSMIEKDLELDDIDMDLGFFSKNQEYYERLSIGNSFTDCILNIGHILKESKAKYHYSDAIFLYDMLDGMYSEDTYTYVDNGYKYHRLIDVCDEYSFFDLSKSNGEYSIKKIRHDEYNKLVKTLRYK